MSLISHLTGYGRFALGLRRFLDHPATLDAGRETIRQRLRERNAYFLNFVRRAVYENGTSPYLSLLRMAGCEYGDLERMIGSDGIESALRRLRDSGVYLTNDEFKCRSEVIRGSTVIRCEPRDFNNPFLAGGVATSSSGSRGAATPTTTNLDRIAYSAQWMAVAASAHGIGDEPRVLWMPILPSVAGLSHLLHSVKMGATPVRWFSPVSSSAIKPPLAKRIGTHYIVHAGRLFGCRMPLPEYVNGEQVHVVVDCVKSLLQKGKGCVVLTTPSAAVKLSQEARRECLDLSGVTFIVGAEPLTPGKLKEVQDAGARALNVYAFAEGGIIGFGCAGHACTGDDVHSLMGSFAVIQRRRETPFGGGTVDAFLFTSLYERTPKVLLNTESGDYGVIEERTCGCVLGELGLTQHLHTIRSFDKLTGEGVTFVGTDLVRIMDEVLPSRFGGVSTDYQMLEVESVEGRTRLDLVVAPSVGDVEEDEVVSVVLAELRKGGDTNRMMAEVWRQSGTLRVRRELPRVTAGGKLLPLHLTKQSFR